MSRIVQYTGCYFKRRLVTIFLRITAKVILGVKFVNGIRKVKAMDTAIDRIVT